MFGVRYVSDKMRETIGNKWMNPIINHFERYVGKVVLVYKQEEIIDVADGYLEAIALAKEKYWFSDNFCVGIFSPQSYTKSYTERSADAVTQSFSQSNRIGGPFRVKFSKLCGKKVLL